MKKPNLKDMTLREKIGQTALGRCDNPGIIDTKKYPYGALWANGDLQFGVNIDEIDKMIVSLSYIRKQTTSNGNQL